MENKILFKLNDIYVTSDTHFGHYNIIKHCNRPFANINEMNDSIIENWNSKINKNSIVIHLGDFAFKHSTSIDTYLSKLNGQKYLVLGNHDNEKEIRKSKLFANVIYGLWDFKYQLSDGSTDKVFLCHYPMTSWNGRVHGRPQLFGHVHLRKDDAHTFPWQPNQYDVGMDLNDFAPLKLSDAIDLAKSDIYKNNLKLKTYPKLEVGVSGES